MSHRAIEESKQIQTSSVEMDCQTMLDKPPLKTTEVVIEDFFVGKRIVHFDMDGDHEWDLVGFALFPTEKQKASYAYRGVIVCCKGVTDQESFDELFRKEDLNQVAVDYWPNRQDLDGNVHSALAAKYLNLDFARSPVVFYGYERTNPLLGETSYNLSYTIGIGAAGIAGLVFVLSAFFAFVGRLFTRKPKAARPPKRPTGNRAGLPSSGNPEHEPTGGVLDQVRSMREKPATK